jgi:hypothetical protein
VWGTRGVAPASGDPVMSGLHRTQPSPTWTPGLCNGSVVSPPPWSLIPLVRALKVSVRPPAVRVCPDGRKYPQGCPSRKSRGRSGYRSCQARSWGLLQKWPSLCYKVGAALILERFSS